MADQLDPSVLYSRTRVVISEAVVFLKAPKVIPTDPTVWPSVLMPSILNVFDELLVRNTFAPPDAPA
jgi:hypothetical protein